jgi:hypothetical protein
MSNFTIEIDDHGLARELAAAPAELSTVIDVATDDAREPMADAFYAVTPVDTGLLRSQNELLAGPGFQVTYFNETSYASFVDARQQFVARGVERGERGVITTYADAIDGFTRTFGGSGE